MANRRSIDNPYGSSPLGPDTSERGLPRYSQELPADTDTEQNGVEPAPTPRQSVPEMTVPDVRESPRDLEEGPIQTVPDVRESPVDIRGHQRREAQKAYAQVHDTLAATYDLDQMNSDQRALFEGAISDGLAEGRSLEEIMAEMERTDTAAYLGLARRQPTPDTFEQLRKGAAEDALFRAEDATRQEKDLKWSQMEEAIQNSPDFNSDTRALALVEASRRIYGTDYPPTREDRMSPETEAAAAEGPMR